MSRIDEALRRATGAKVLRDDRSLALETDVRTDTIDPSILDRYVVEASANPRESVSVLHQVAPAAVVSAASVPAERLSIPSSLEGKLVVGRDISPLTVEQYRRLAAVLDDLRVQQGLKSV